MGTINRSVLIDAPQAAVWSALADFQAVGDFHPTITSVNLESDHNGGLGSKRTCHFKDGTKISEEIVDWRDGESFTVVASNYSFPLKSMRASMGVRSVDGKSEAFMKMEYVPKFGPLGKLMGMLMMNRMMGKIMDAVLEGLRAHLTTSQPAAEAA